jgi:restriction endonuclease S subunit
VLFSEIFKPIEKGNFGLTDEAIYKSIDYDNEFIAIWGGTEDHSIVERLVSEKGRTKKNERITTFGGVGIILSLDGSAGSMTYVNRQKFALNHHAAFLQLRDDAKDKVDLEFFSLFYEKQLQEASVSKGGSKTLATTVLKQMDFDVPPLSVQTNIMSQIKPMLEKRKTIQAIMEKLRMLKSQVIAVNYKNYQAQNVPVNAVLDCASGNSGLTEMEIYHNILVEGDRYEVLSSATVEEKKLGFIPRCQLKGKKLKVENQEGILVSRNGNYAGTVIFRDKGQYALTDHAYFLTLNPSCPYSVSLKWFVCQYRQIFFDYTSSNLGGNNATWNKTGFFETVRIDIPSLEEQMAVVKEFDRLESLEKRLEELCSRMEHVFGKEIVTA